jgi:hypothetical protein
MLKSQKTADQPTKPGEYQKTRPKGGKVSKPREVAMEKGDQSLSPTRKSGRT